MGTQEVRDVSATPFGKELRRVRRAAELNLADLAEVLNCSVVYVSQIERGDKPPPNAAAIAKLLGRIGCPERLQEMLRLAALSRRAVEIGLKDKSEQQADMLVSLARKSDEGEIDDETARQILALLNRSRESQQ